MKILYKLSILKLTKGILANTGRAFNACRLKSSVDAKKACKALIFMSTTFVMVAMVRAKIER